ncbi:unnamed protein product [Cladocopium goreaui]|uniref:Cullin family profile domain-containing protein n=1 Tax=Cladocopium goreaui TaxID=2562237 RepID=A0A9P1CH12_9DINO|nr:unnamed protein product [Cladocopium goreaui]
MSPRTTMVGPPGAPCELPPEVQECCSRFETFYLAKHTGRKLFWQPQNGFADIKAQMPKTKHELNVTTYQMCILMLFNQQTTWTYQDLAVRTNIPLEELKRHLMSLYVNPKAKILVKLGDSEKKEPEESDQFTVNPQFESKLVRIKVPLVQLKSSETPAAGREGESGAVGSSDVPATVEEDRKHLVEAVVVRVMKSRKTLEHNQLVMEVTRHLTSRFQPSPTLIKQRIEKLIEREYLERSQGDRRVYNYLA